LFKVFNSLRRLACISPSLPHVEFRNKTVFLRDSPLSIKAFSRKN